MFLQITMPIIMPISSGTSRPWVDSDTKVCIAVYLAIAVLWFLCALYHILFRQMTFREAMSFDTDSFLLWTSNGIFYVLTIVLTIIALIAVIGVGIYNIL
jgi:hypothetical protein